MWNLLTFTTVSTKYLKTIAYIKVPVGNNQEKAQSERNSKKKRRWEKLN